MSFLSLVLARVVWLNLGLLITLVSVVPKISLCNPGFVRLSFFGFTVSS